MKFRDKGILPTKDMRGMTGDEYVEWLIDYLIYHGNDSNLPKIPPGDMDSYYDELGQSLKDHGRGPIGKRVI